MAARSVAPLFAHPATIATEPGNASAQNPANFGSGSGSGSVAKEPKNAKDGKLPDNPAPPKVDVVGDLVTIQAHSGSPFEALSSGGLAVATIAGLVMLGRRRWARWPLLPLLGVGAMSLTAYSAHIVVLGFWPRTDQTSNWYLAWLLLGLIVGCAVWRRFFTSGPIEQAVSAFADRMKTAQRPRSERSTA